MEPKLKGGYCTLNDIYMLCYLLTYISSLQLSLVVFLYFEYDFF